MGTGGPAPSSIVTPLPSLSPATPGTPVPPVGIKFGYAAKGMRGEVMAFVPDGQLAYARDQLDYGAVSTIALFALQADGNGRLIRRGLARQAGTSQAMDAVIARVPRGHGSCSPSSASRRPRPRPR